jgi:hypothetical protein
MPATPGRRDAADQRIARLLLLVEGQRRLVADLRAAGRESQLATALLRELEQSLELLRSCRRLLG